LRGNQNRHRQRRKPNAKAPTSIVPMGANEASESATNVSIIFYVRCIFYNGNFDL
jgi:hypothetical protein